MTAPMKFNLETSEPIGPESIGIDTPTPDKLAITPRNRRFPREKTLERYWMGGDPVATAWQNALSVTFPRGEAFFIEAVQAHRKGVPPKLEKEIRAFIKQEINHTREHLAFNRAAIEGGYDISNIEQRIDKLLSLANERPKILNLAAAMALEHFTAMMSHEFLKNPAHFKNATAETADLWLWHAAEEVEHKGVTYDTWLHATREWSRWKRWKIKTLLMLVVTRNFFANRVEDTLDLLAQDGLTGMKWKLRVFAYLLWKPGILRRIFPAWMAYSLPGFHPWKIDDRHLIEKYDSEFTDAVMPS